MHLTGVHSIDVTPRGTPSTSRFAYNPAMSFFQVPHDPALRVFRMSKLSLSDEVLMEIGKIIVIFSWLEDSLAEMIGVIVTIGGRPLDWGSIVTAELSFKQRVGMLDSLLLFTLGKEHEVVREFVKLKRLLSSAEIERNRVVHSVWANRTGVEDPHATVRMKTTAKQRAGLRRDWQPLDLDGLQRIIGVVSDAYGQISRFQLHFQES